jgi:hypothetical protein
MRKHPPQVALGQEAIGDAGSLRRVWPESFQGNHLTGERAFDAAPAIDVAHSPSADEIAHFETRNFDAVLAASSGNKNLPWREQEVPEGPSQGGANVAVALKPYAGNILMGFSPAPCSQRGYAQGSVVAGIWQHQVSRLSSFRDTRAPKQGPAVSEVDDFDGSMLFGIVSRPPFCRSAYFESSPNAMSLGYRHQVQEQRLEIGDDAEIDVSQLEAGEIGSPGRRSQCVYHPALDGYLDVSVRRREDHLDDASRGHHFPRGDREPSGTDVDGLLSNEALRGTPEDRQVHGQAREPPELGHSGAAVVDERILWPRGRGKVESAAMSRRAPQVIRWTLWVTCLIASVVVSRHALGRWADFQGYIDCGEAVLAGRYGPEFGGGIPYWVWPPFFTYACIPLAWFARLGDVGPKLIWLILNGGLAWVVLRKWVTGVVPAEHRSVVTPIVALVSMSFLAANLNFHQINLAVLALFVFGVAEVERRRPWLGGAAVGLAAALKVWPALLLPYLFVRGERRAVLSATAVGLLSLVTPAALFGPSRAWQLTCLWFTRNALSAGGAHGFRNQALGGVLARFFTSPDWGVPGAPVAFIGGLGVPECAWLALILGAGLFALLTWQVARRAGKALLVDVAVLVPAAQLLVSPVMWMHYLVNLWGALALIASACWPLSGEPGRRAPRGLIALAIGGLVLVAAQERALTGYRVSSLSMAYDSGFVLVVVMVVVAEWARRLTAPSLARPGEVPAAHPWTLPPMPDPLPQPGSSL